VRICGAPVPKRSIKHPFGMQPWVGSPIEDAMFSADSNMAIFIVKDSPGGWQNKSPLDIQGRYGLQKRLDVPILAEYEGGQRRQHPAISSTLVTLYNRRGLVKKPLKDTRKILSFLDLHLYVPSTILCNRILCCSISLAGLRNTTLNLQL
jgi:hypothetical protein